MGPQGHSCSSERVKVLAFRQGQFICKPKLHSQEKKFWPEDIIIAGKFILEFGAKIFSGRNTGPKFSARNAILLSEFWPDILAGNFRPAHESTLKNSSVDKKPMYSLFYT